MSLFRPPTQLTNASTFLSLNRHLKAQCKTILARPTEKKRFTGFLADSFRKYWESNGQNRVRTFVFYQPYPEYTPLCFRRVYSVCTPTNTFLPIRPLTSRNLSSLTLNLSQPFQVGTTTPGSSSTQWLSTSANKNGLHTKKFSTKRVLRKQQKTQRFSNPTNRFFTPTKKTGRSTRKQSGQKLKQQYHSLPTHLPSSTKKYTRKTPSVWHSSLQRGTAHLSRSPFSPYISKPYQLGTQLRKNTQRVARRVQKTRNRKVAKIRKTLKNRMSTVFRPLLSTGVTAKSKRSSLLAAKKPKAKTSKRRTVKKRQISHTKRKAKRKHRSRTTKRPRNVQRTKKSKRSVKASRLTGQKRKQPLTKVSQTKQLKAARRLETAYIKSKKLTKPHTCPKALLTWYKREKKREEKQGLTAHWKLSSRKAISKLKNDISKKTPQRPRLSSVRIFLRKHLTPAQFEELRGKDARTLRAQYQSVRQQMSSATDLVRARKLYESLKAKNKTLPEDNGIAHDDEALLSWYQQIRAKKELAAARRSAARQFKKGSLPFHPALVSDPVLVLWYKSKSAKRLKSRKQKQPRQLL